MKRRFMLLETARATRDDDPRAPDVFRAILSFRRVSRVRAPVRCRRCRYRRHRRALSVRRSVPHRTAPRHNRTLPCRTDTKFKFCVTRLGRGPEDSSASDVVPRIDPTVPVRGNVANLSRFGRADRASFSSREPRAADPLSPSFPLSRSPSRRRARSIELSLSGAARALSPPPPPPPPLPRARVINPILGCRTRHTDATRRYVTRARPGASGGAEGFEETPRSSENTERARPQE